MAEVEAKITVKGIPAALHLLNNVPGGLAGPTAKGAMDVLLEEGISLMSTHVSDLIRTDKSRGTLAASIEGTKEVNLSESEDEVAGTFNITIGSAEAHAEYAAREIGWSKIGENVLIEPMGRWVFIDVRPPIPAHPFLEYTLFDLLNTVMPKALAQHFVEASIRIQNEVNVRQRALGGISP